MNAQVLNGVFTLSGVVIGGVLGYLSTYYSDRRRDRIDREKQHFADLETRVLGALEGHGVNHWLPFLDDQGIDATPNELPGGDHVKQEFRHAWVIGAKDIDSMPQTLQDDPLYGDAKTNHYGAILNEWDRLFEDLTAFRGQVIERARTFAKTLKDQCGDQWPPIPYEDGGNSNGARYEILGAYAYRHLWSPRMAGSLAITQGGGDNATGNLIIQARGAACAHGPQVLVTEFRDVFSAFLQKQNIEDLKERAGVLKNNVRGLLGRVAAARSARKLPGRCEWV
ncbi:MAG: hypothetical protein ACYDEV_00310 [Acidiferrobacter sp.]